MRIAATLTSVALVVVLAGCIPSTTAPLPAAVEEHSHNQEPEVPAAPVWTVELRQEAIDSATDVLRAFGDTSGGQDQWWARLEPLLTTTGARAYSSVLVENVPSFTIIGEAEVTDETVDYLATVEVPTSNGTYSLLLQRLSVDLPWKAERITPEASR